MSAFNVTGPEGAAVQGAPAPRDRYDDGYRNDYRAQSARADVVTKDYSNRAV